MGIQIQTAFEISNMNSVILTYWHLFVLGSFLLGLLVFFIVRFLIPAWRLKRALSSVIDRLQQMKDAHATADPGKIGREIMTSDKLKHLWSEFTETLHPQTAPDAMGQERIVRWRATLPSEAYFNVESLVAVELRTEYFKHQPGILTGIGIIGTFWGLIRGLSTFSVSSDPEKVRASLDALIRGVLEAFLVSATAIFLAMVTTFLEKTIIVKRIKQVEELCHLIDSFFDAGAGEEYLARLVKAGETSATQTAQLKDALVADLKEMLAEMTRQQAEAIAASFQKVTQEHVSAIAQSSKAQVETTEQSGERIALAITESLSDPIQKIAAAVQSTSDTNGQVVTRALNEVMVTFSQKLEDMFGGQMANVNQLLMQTTASMQATVSRFDQLAGNLDSAGKSAADAMSERLSAALESMEARQLSLNNTMSDFVGQLRDMVKSSQTETNEQLRQTFALMGEKLAAMVAQMEEQARRASSAHIGQQDLLAQNSSRLAAEMGGQVQATLHALQQQFGSVVETLKAQVAQAASANESSQARLAQNTQGAVESLSSRVETSIATLDEKMSGFVSLLKQQAEAAANSHQSSQQQLAEQANHVLEQVSLQIQALVTQTHHAVSAMQGTVAAMRDITGESSRRMEASAETLAIAADDFSKAGNSVSGVVQHAGVVGEKLALTAGALSSAASVVNTALSDYHAAREAITNMVAELRAVVEVARQDASVSQSLVSQMQQSAQQLEKAHTSVGGYFEQVCDELAKAHEAFGQNVENTLKRSNSAFQKELKDAVDYLKTAVEELGDVADAIPARK